MKCEANAYPDPAMVAQVTRQLVDAGNTVFQIHRLAESQSDHVGELLSFFEPGKGASILDVGCGVGGVADLMSKSRPDLQFTLLNNSAEQLAICPPQFKTICADAHDMPVPSESLDAVMICYAIGHMDIERALKECSRVTKKGGMLYLYDLTADECRLIDAFGCEAFSTKRIISSAAEAGYLLDKIFAPEAVHVEHFYDKMPKARFVELFAGIKPALFRFRKRTPAPISKIAGLKRRIVSIALAALMPSGV